jgi:hypothetical protein
MWNSGMMFSPRSADEKPQRRAMFCAEAARLACVSGTIFGREVVPEVCSTIETSPGWASPARAAGVAAGRSRSKSPAPPSARGTSSITRTPCRWATATAGEALPRSTISARACRSAR